jgi:hypothetical protein
MSSLGQLSARLDRNLTLVGNLAKALLALQADLNGKLDALRLTREDTRKGREILEAFLVELVPALSGNAVPTRDEYRTIYTKLQEAGEQPLDWAEDFGKMINSLQANVALDAQELEKLTRIVGYLQGEAAEDVRRLRSR